MRMLIFPYGHDCEPIVRHADMLEQCYVIAALVSPGGWGLAGKKIMVGTGGNVLPVHENFEEVTEEYDSLFIPPFEVADEAVENRIVDKMLTIIPRLSHVLCAARITDTNRMKLKEVCSHVGRPCTFIDICECKGLETYGLAVPTKEYPSLQLMDVPVVVVVGLWEKSDKFEVSLSLRERFLRDGYRISQIGSREGCEMMGFHSFPKFMFQKDLDGSVKIPCFNRWIQQIVRREQPDVVLVTIPGASQDFNEQFTRGFGLLHHEVFQAVAPDVLVMCTYYMNKFSEAPEELSRSCKYKFGAPVDVFHISNLFIDVIESEERRSIVTNSIYRETVSQTVAKGSKDSSIPIFNALDSEESDRMYETIIKKMMPRNVQVVL